MRKDKGTDALKEFVKKENGGRRIYMKKFINFFRHWTNRQEDNSNNNIF